MNDHTYYMKQALELAQKAQKNEEKLIDRSLVFGWTSIGLEIGYYF